MGFKKIERDQRINKVIEILRIGGKSEKTIENYSCAINRFLNYFCNQNIELLDENHILEYLKIKYLSNPNCSINTYNLNLSAIKYFYLISFNKEFNNTLLPHAKLTKKLPTVIDKETFINLVNKEKFLKHKCWLLLAYCSGLRTIEISSIKISDINSKEHKLKVLGKGKKERYTVLTDFTIECLRMYYSKYIKTRNNSDYLFPSNNNSKHINCKTITNYFTSLKYKYNLDENISFHSLRHSFATNFIKAGGDPFILKSMLGHSSLNTTSIYIHMGRDFNNLKGVNYDRI